MLNDDHPVYVYNISMFTVEICFKPARVCAETMPIQLNSSVAIAI